MELQAGDTASRELERIEKFLKESPSKQQLEAEASSLWDANAGRPGLREVACKLMEAAGHSELPEKQFPLAQSWALTGKAWLERGSYDAALRCLSRVPERQGDASWTEVLVQTQLWTATAFLQKASYQEAMEAFAKAAKLRPEQTSWKAAEAMVLLRERGEVKAALELVENLNLEGPNSLRPFGSKATVAEVLRQRSLCLLELKDLAAAEQAARKVMTMELNETTGRARSLKVLLKVLCAKERSQLLPDASELQELSLDLMSQKRATLVDGLETCRVIAESALDRLFMKCLQRLRRRSWEVEEQRQLRLFGAQMLAARVEEVMRGGGAAEKELVVDNLCSWVDEAKHLEDAKTAGVGHLLWNLARSLKPQEALLWLQKALPFLPEAPVWRAMAFCHHQLGDASNRRRCLDAALQHGPSDGAAHVLLLIDAAGRGEAFTVQRVVEKMKRKELQVTPDEVAFVLNKLASMAISPQQLVILELLLTLLGEEKNASLSSASVLQMYFEAADHLGPQHLLKAVGRMKDVKLDEDQRTWLVQLLMHQAKRASIAEDWGLCAKLSQAAAERLSPRGGEQFAALCAAAAEALLHEPEAAEEALAWARKGLGALDDSRRGDEISMRLRDLEAEAAGRLGQVVPSLKCAWAALAEHPQVTLQVLREGDLCLDAVKAPAAGRECVRLLLQNGHVPSVLQEVQRLQEMMLQHEVPVLETLWLAATSWNAGAELLAKGDPCGQQFLQKATALLQVSDNAELKSIQKEMHLQLAATA